VTTNPNLSPAAKKLLREIAKHGDEGIVFHYTSPGQRWRMDGTDYTVTRRTFLQLSGARFIDVGGDGDDPVKVTAAGRAYLAAPPAP
jgi:hypothetical protein